MGTILVTGPSGMIAGALIKSLVKAGNHTVIGMGRSGANLGVEYDFVGGEFYSFEEALHEAVEGYFSAHFAPYP